MNRRISLIAALFVAAVALSLAGDPPPNEYVAFKARLAPGPLRAGGRAELLFSLTPKEGIHINVKPAMELKLEPGSPFALDGKLRLESMKADTLELLNAARPVRQGILLAHSAKPGTLTLRGTLVYYYCSDAEGWCSRYRQPVALTVTDEVTGWGRRTDRKSTRLNSSHSSISYAVFCL